MPRAWSADLDADQLAVDPPLVDRAQRVAADEVLLLLELDHPLVAVADLVGVLLDRHVAAMREDASLDPPDVTGSGRREAMRLAGLDQRVPQLEPVATGVAEIELIAELARVAGARNDKPHAVKLAVDHVVVRDLEDVGAERSVMTSLDFGPWTCTGATSGSAIRTSSPA